MKDNHPVNHVSDARATAICKIGQGALCCRYLTVDKDGLGCDKHTDLRVVLDERAKSPGWSAVADNCPGLGVL